MKIREKKEVQGNNMNYTYTYNEIREWFLETSIS